MNQERVMQVLLAPHVSEKTTLAADQDNQYVFRVEVNASKPEIRKAVESLFEVQVEKVRVLKNKGKNKRFGQTLGRRKDWKKAYVTLKSGQEIDFLGGE